MKGFGFLAAASLCATIFPAIAQEVQSPAVQSPPAAGSAAAVKVLRFKQTSQGACVLQGGTVTFDGSGNAAVKLATMTTEGDDIWKARIRLRSVAGTDVFTSPELNSPKMENQDGHPQTYSWSYSFHVDPSLVPSVAGAEMIDIKC